MNDAPQHTLPAHVQDGLVERAVNLLSDHVLSIAGLTLLGMLIGMAAVGVVRLFLSDVEDQGPPEWKARALLLRRLGAASSGLWTLLIQVVYLQAIGTAWLGTAVVALGAGLLAAAGNHPAYKPVKATWRWLLAKLRKRIEADHGAGSATDLDDTTFKKP